MLFAAWTGQLHRPTRDLDLLGIGASSNAVLTQICGEIVRTPVASDGLEFEGRDIRLSDIRQTQDCPGKRIKLPARLGNARLQVQIDVGLPHA